MPTWEVLGWLAVGLGIVETVLALFIKEPR
jgi:hypothetical protein